ncbi:MAG: hypothetical protein JWM09_335 [Francisellaceae bacterium]|nr:hypothetical protein [Francisellaceae bacterium]
MRHLKTKFGVFWIAERSSKNGQYYLGIDNYELGLYQDAEQAALDVYSQVTGFLKWDSQLRVLAPKCLNDWSMGAPLEWQEIQEIS